LVNLINYPTCVFASTLRQSVQAQPLQKVPLAKQSQYSFRHWLFLQWQVRIGLQTQHMDSSRQYTAGAQDSD
jgi:hypothetical protein